ncbi:MAG: hypothetical protein LBL98_07980 [Ruminococcus sp.]|jgi:hypothetical protein|nr:hypothetical protein [Ruminococcus sp.]
MKKEELIKKAAERGVVLDEAQAEKYTELSDEELDNLSVSGGGCGTPDGKKIDDKTYAAKCAYFNRKNNTPITVTYCIYCTNAETQLEGSFPHNFTVAYCQCREAFPEYWQGR